MKRTQTSTASYALSCSSNGEKVSDLFFLAKTLPQNEVPCLLSAGDRAFLNSSYAKPLLRGKRNVNTHGYILNNGALLVEQTNQRLKNADHRFYLKVSVNADLKLTHLLPDFAEIKLTHP